MTALFPFCKEGFFSPPFMAHLLMPVAVKQLSLKLVLDLDICNKAKCWHGAVPIAQLWLVFALNLGLGGNKT